MLGPLLPGRDPLEDALTAFAGAPGGPIMHAWEAGLPPRSGPGLQPGEQLETSGNCVASWNQVIKLIVFDAL